MVRPTEWRRYHFQMLDRGYHDIHLVTIQPGETLVRTILTFACYTPVQEQNTAPDVRLAYALKIFPGDEAGPSSGSPLSNYYDYEDAVWWDGCCPVPYVYTTAVSPPSEVAMYAPPGGTIDTPVMRRNDTAGPVSLWFQTENEDWQNRSHEGMGYCSALIKLAA